MENSAGLSGLGVNTDVMHNLSLKEESQGLRICEQPIDSGAQKAGHERGVGEVARGGLGGRLLGPQTRGPCGLVLNEEHPLGQVVKGGNGGRANSRREQLVCGHWDFPAHCLDGVSHLEELWREVSLSVASTPLGPLQARA